MSIEKCETKRLLVQSIGKTINNYETKSKNEIQQMDGALYITNEIYGKVSKLKNKWNDDFNKKQIKSQELKIADRVFENIFSILNETKNQIFSKKNQKNGEISAYEKCLDICEKIFEEEGLKSKLLLEAKENKKEDGKRVLGQHPGDSLKKKREEKKQEEKKKNGNNA